MTLKETCDKVFGILHCLFHIAKAHNLTCIVGVEIALHGFDFVIPTVGVIFLENVGEIIPLSLIDAFVHIDAAEFHIVPSHLFCLFIGLEFFSLVVAENVSCEDLVGFIFPSVIEYHEVTDSLGNHVVEEITGHIGIIRAFLASDCGYVVTLVIDLCKEFFLLLGCVEVVGQILKRCGDDDLVVLFHILADIDLNFAVFTSYFRDVDVETCRMLKFCIDCLVNALRTVFPRPQIFVDKVHCGCEVKVFNDVCSRDFIKETITECGIRSDPDLLCKFNLVEFAEICKVHREFFEVGVFADNVFARYGIVTVVLALCNSLVTGVLISLILGCKKCTEFFDLGFDFQKVRNEERVFLGIERIVFFTVFSAICTFEFRTVVIYAAEQFEFVNSIVRRATHNCAHFKSLSIVIRRVAFAADMIFSFENSVIGVTILLKMYCCAKSGRTCADDTNLFVLCHNYLLRFCKW